MPYALYNIEMDENGDVRIHLGGRLSGDPIADVSALAATARGPAVAYDIANNRLVAVANNDEGTIVANLMPHIIPAGDPAAKDLAKEVSKGA